MPEAAKALDPGLLDSTIQAWMKANGFEQVGDEPADMADKQQQEHSLYFGKNTHSYVIYLGSEY